MRRVVIVSIGLLLLIGCGPKNKKGTLAGKITYKTQPVNGATLFLFAPGSNKQEDAIPVAVGQDGTFRLADVPPGDYKIVVEGMAPPPNMPGMKVKGEKAAEAEEKLRAMQGGNKPTIPFPDKYKSLAKTDLTCTVTAGQTELNLELKD